MRSKFIREFRKRLIQERTYCIYDIDEIIHIANMIFKKCNKEFKEYKRKKKKYEY